jgi:hypothetical protein
VAQAPPVIDHVRAHPAALLVDLFDSDDFPMPIRDPEAAAEADGERPGRFLARRVNLDEAKLLEMIAYQSVPRDRI